MQKLLKGTARKVVLHTTIVDVRREKTKSLGRQAALAPEDDEECDFL
jgi:hypothetical protein